MGFFERFNPFRAKTEKTAEGVLSAGLRSASSDALGKAQPSNEFYKERAKERRPEAALKEWRALRNDYLAGKEDIVYKDENGRERKVPIRVALRNAYTDCRALRALAGPRNAETNQLISIAEGFESEIQQLDKMRAEKRDHGVVKGAVEGLKQLLKLRDQGHEAYGTRKGNRPIRPKARELHANLRRLRPDLFGPDRGKIPADFETFWGKATGEMKVLNEDAIPAAPTAPRAEQVSGARQGEPVIAKAERKVPSGDKWEAVYKVFKEQVMSDVLTVMRVNGDAIRNQVFISSQFKELVQAAAQYRREIIAEKQKLGYATEKASKPAREKLTSKFAVFCTEFMPRDTKIEERQMITRGAYSVLLRAVSSEQLISPRALPVTREEVKPFKEEGRIAA